MAAQSVEVAPRNSGEILPTGAGIGRSVPDVARFACQGILHEYVPLVLTAVQLARPRDTTIPTGGLRMGTGQPNEEREKNVSPDIGA